MNRRDFMTIGTSVLSLPYMGGFADGAMPPAPKKEKSIVFLFLSGGPTHIEWTHAYPSLVPGIRSMTGSLETKVPGLYLGGHFEGLAERADKINWIQNYQHSQANHQNAVYWQLSGRGQNQLFQTEPSVGALATKMFGPTNLRTGLPTYLCNSRIEGDGGAWVGNHYVPFEANGKGLKDLTLNIPLDRFAQRMDFIKTIEKQRNFIGQQMWSESQKLRGQATDLLVGDVRKAFEIKDENDKIRDAYGRNNVGDSMLLARKLVQNGGRFIQVQVGGWDMHQNLVQGMDRLAPQVDKAISAFIDETKSLGLDKDVLLVVTGDFGRTYKTNQTAGRDHWARLCTLFMYGGDFEAGRTIGKANKEASEPADGESSPKDLAFTMLSHLGLNPYTQITDLSQRPRFLTDPGARNLLI